jgi:vacuolar-type H+-ATPase subunit F/Vma7
VTDYAVRVLCRSGTGTGFSLAGLHTVEADDATAAVERVRDLKRDRDTGVILVEDSVHRDLPEDVRRSFSRRPLPMLVPFPGPGWTERAAGAEAYIVELLRQVVGYRVRLR